MIDLNRKPEKHETEMTDVEIIATVLTICVWVFLIIGVMASC